MEVNLDVITEKPLRVTLSGKVYEAKPLKMRPYLATQSLQNKLEAAYKKNDKWYAFDRYCFISPIPVEESYIYKPITHEPLMATMEMPNEYLKSQGIKKGDKITFRPDNEYEFIVDGKKMYRSFDHQIVAKL